MTSNLDPFKWLFGGPGLRCGPNDALKLNFDVVAVFSKRNPVISTDFAHPLERISRSCSAGIWFRRFNLSIGVWPLLWRCTPSRFFDFTHATQDRYTAPAAFLFPELRCVVFTQRGWRRHRWCAETLH